MKRINTLNVLTTNGPIEACPQKMRLTSINREKQGGSHELIIGINKNESGNYEPTDNFGMISIIKEKENPMNTILRMNM